MTRLGLVTGCLLGLAACFADPDVIGPDWNLSSAVAVTCTGAEGERFTYVHAAGGGAGECTERTQIGTNSNEDPVFDEAPIPVTCDGMASFFEANPGRCHPEGDTFRGVSSDRANLVELFFTEVGEYPIEAEFQAGWLRTCLFSDGQFQPNQEIAAAFFTGERNSDTVVLADAGAHGFLRGIRRCD